MIPCKHCGSTMPARRTPPASRLILWVLTSFLCGVGLVGLVADIFASAARGSCVSCGRYQ